MQQGCWHWLASVVRNNSNCVHMFTNFIQHICICDQFRPSSRWSKRRELEPGTSKLFYLLFGSPIGRGAGRPIGRDGGSPIGRDYCCCWSSDRKRSRWSSDRKSIQKRASLAPLNVRRRMHLERHCQAPPLATQPSQAPAVRHGGGARCVGVGVRRGGDLRASPTSADRFLPRRNPSDREGIVVGAPHSPPRLPPFAMVGERGA